MTGADGFLVADPLQYLNWLRQAGEHGLIGNLYDLAPGDARVRAPGRARLRAALAARRWAGGRLPALEAGRRAACCSPARWRWCGASCRAATTAGLALVLALFACSPVAALVGWAGSGRRGDKLRSTSSPASCGPARTCGATCSRRSRSGCCRSGCWRTSGGGRRGLLAAAAARAALRVAAAVAGRDVRAVHGRGGGAGAGCAAARTARGGARSLALPLVATAAPLVYYVLLGALRRRVGARGRASTTCRAGRGGCWCSGSRPSPSRRRSRTGCPRRRSATSRCGSGRSPRWSSTSSRSARSRSTRSRASRYRWSCSARSALRALARRAAHPAVARGGGGRLLLVRRGHRVPRERARRRGEPRPPAVHADRGGARRAARPRRRPQSPAASSRRCTPGSSCRPTPAARRGSAPARGRPTSSAAAGGRGALRRAS